MFCRWFYLNAIAEAERGGVEQQLPPILPMRYWDNSFVIYPVFCLLVSFILDVERNACYVLLTPREQSFGAKVFLFNASISVIIMLSAIKTALIDLKDAISEQFEGRYTRSDFFFYTLLVGIIHAAVLALFYLSMDNTVLVTIINIPIAFLVYMPATVKRAHDIGHKGNFIVILWLIGQVVELLRLMTADYLLAEIHSIWGRAIFLTQNGIPLIIAMYLWAAICGPYIFILLFKDSQKGTNKYGPSPKYPEKTSLLDKPMSYNKVATSVESDKLQESEDKNYSS